MSGRNLVTVAAVLVVAGLITLLTFGLIEKNDEAIAVGDPAPQPELTELATGDEASLADYRGQWVLVNLWSSWCEPCRAESPDLEAFSKAHPEVAVVGINLEDVSDDADAFVEEFGLTYPQLRATDNRGIREAYGAIARPENYLIDPEGKIAMIRRGPVDEEVLSETVEPLIEARS